MEFTGTQIKKSLEKKWFTIHILRVPMKNKKHTQYCILKRKNCFKKKKKKKKIGLKNIKVF